MRIALCLEYNIGQFGGTEVLVRELLHGLAAEGHELILVSPDDAVSLEKSGLKPLIRQHIAWNPRRVNRSTSCRLAVELSLAAVELAHFHFGGNYGWGIRVPGASPFPFAAARGIPCISTIHLVGAFLEGFCGPEKPLWFKLALLPGAWLGKLHALKHLRAEVVVSRGGCARERRWYFPFRTRLRSIYHSRLRADAPAPRAMNEREKTVVALGHLAPRKGQLVLTKAFAQIATEFPDWTLQLLGGPTDTWYGDEIRRAAEKIGATNRVLLHGSRADALEFVNRAAVFVQPSQIEGLPLSLQEAMFYGCACIATTVPGNVELIQHGHNGLLVPWNDPSALAGALKRLMADESLRTACAHAGRESVVSLGMTSAEMLRQYLELYRDVIDRGKRSA